MTATEALSGVRIVVGDEADGRAMIGELTLARVAEVPINQAMIQHYASVLEDANPLYWDDDYAARVTGSRVSPPGMLMVWLKPMAWNPYEAVPPHTGVIATLVPLPADQAINVETDSEFFARMPVGATLSGTETLLSISERKETNLGPGYFVKTRVDYRTEDGTLVARNTNTLLRFSKAEK